MISRVFALALLVFVMGCSGPSGPDSQDWTSFKSYFITPAGRILDTHNNNTSHSEGQGIGMLLSVAHNDRKTFEQIYAWTVKHLQIRDDRLFAWTWSPDSQPPVSDLNNASDGDILIAWALYLAAERWNNPDYRQAANGIADDIRAKLVRLTPHYGLVLLPAEKGFEARGRITVNLSYWVFPAFVLFERENPAPEWRQLNESGLKLLQVARFGRWQLPPDWLEIEKNQLHLPDKFAPHFGYNAVRIPLYLIWSKFDDTQRLEPFRVFWSYFVGGRFTPAWADLTDNSVDSYDMSPGFYAIRDLVFQQTKYKSDLSDNNPIDQQEDYYSTSLRMLAQLAWVSTG